jgi:hypothetical protein
MKNTRVLVPIICVLLGLGAGFFGGIEYKNYQANKARANFAAGGTTGSTERFTGTRSGTNGTTRGGAVMGSVLSMDDKSVTVKMSDGSSKIVLFGDSTTYTNTIDATKSDLKVGVNVAIFGTSNSDGSVTATNVQINPKFQMNFGASNQTSPTTKTKTTTTQQQSNFGFGGPPPGM